jgi:hypothetical protein
MLSTSTRKNLKYFENKVVTFFTGPINRNFDEDTLVNYFVGKITKIDDDGIWYEHVGNSCQNFIFYNSIISIAEEMVKEKSDALSS